MGALIGGVVTGVVILVLLICLLFFLRRRKRRGAHVRVLGGGAPGSRLVRSWTRRGILADEIVSPYPVSRSESSTPSSSAAKSQTSQVRGATQVSQQTHESSAPSASTSTITTVGASSLSHPSRSTDGHIHSRLVVNDSPNKNDLPALRSQVAALHKEIERLQDQRR